MNRLLAHLKDNSGDENITKVIWVVIVFVVGSIMLAMVTGAFNGIIKPYYKNLVSTWFDTNNGAYGTHATLD